MNRDDRTPEEYRIVYPADLAIEREDVLARFATVLALATGDGSTKRQRGEKPPWYRDDSHRAALFSHLSKYEHGELVDADSGAHPLVHLAWRALAIALIEMDYTPDADNDMPRWVLERD